MTFLRDAVGPHVDRGDVPGAVVAVRRDGEEHLEAFGVRSLSGREPMLKDTLFRITSMTKPIVAAAAMRLVEEGRLVLDDAVDRWLPELANRRVLATIDGAVEDTVPATRAVTLRDLLTFRMGYGMILAPPDTYPIQRIEGALGLMLGPPKPRTALAPDEWMRRFGTLPLLQQPGDAWMYNTSAHVLGVLLARAAGQDLEAVLRIRLFEPLGMKDTSFTVPADKRGRFCEQVRRDPQTRALEITDRIDDSQWLEPPSFPDGAAGLISTAPDYLAFAQMLLDGGTYRGARVLSAESVRAMTTNHLTREQRRPARLLLGTKRGWGFGMAVLTEADGPSSAGRYGWEGGFGSSWANDPSRGLIGVALTTCMFDGPDSLPPVLQDFWAAAYRV